MIARTRDESLKDIIVVLTRLQKDLNGVGNNYNQMLHKLHIMDEYEEIKAWVISYELEKRSLFESIERSEEHTSELQSLMRISYAVFCLKKKKNIHKK